MKRREDRLHIVTRLTYMLLAVLTAIFGPLLFLFPSHTADYWAWPIRPDMSAVWVGCGYTFGGIAISTMLLVGRWRSAIVPVLSTWPFAVVMLAATLIHNDRFFTDKLGYYLWLAVYVLLPVLLPLAYALNRSADPGVGKEDMALSQRLRLAMICLGLVVAALGTVLVVQPDALDDSWPWPLTPLMSRVIGGWLLFIATGGLCAYFERRYIAYRYYIPEAALWFTLILIGSLTHMNDFDWDRISTPLFFATIPLIIVTLVLLFVLMERKYSLSVVKFREESHHEEGEG